MTVSVPEMLRLLGDVNYSAQGCRKLAPEPWIHGLSTMWSRETLSFGLRLGCWITN